MSFLVREIGGQNIHVFGRVKHSPFVMLIVCTLATAVAVDHTSMGDHFHDTNQCTVSYKKQFGEERNRTERILVWAPL